MLRITPPISFIDTTPKSFFLFREVRKGYVSSFAMINFLQVTAREIKYSRETLLISLDLALDELWVFSVPSIAAVASLCIHFLYFPQSQHCRFLPAFVNLFRNDDEDANDHGGSTTLDLIRAVLEFRVKTSRF